MQDLEMVFQKLDARHKAEPARDARLAPSDLDPWLDRNSQCEDRASEFREARSGVRMVGYVLLAITFAVFGAIYWINL